MTYVNDDDVLINVIGNVLHVVYDR